MAALHYSDGEYTGETVRTQDGSRKERHGRGEQLFKSSGSKYLGEWRRDKPHGRGVWTEPDGSTYTGMFVSGQRHGQGVAIFAASGDEYEGEFQQDQLTVGRYTYARDQSVFRGTFRFGRPYEGRVEWPSGEFVHGTFDERGRPHGESVRRRYADGSLYEGAFHHGTRVTHGATSASTSTTATAFLSNATSQLTTAMGTAHSHTGIKWRAGDQWHGACLDGVPHGLGKRAFASGARVYLGSYQNGRANDENALEKANGTRAQWEHTGAFRDGRPLGPGTRKWRNGNTYQGPFGGWSASSTASSAPTYVIHVASVDSSTIAAVSIPVPVHSAGPMRFFASGSQRPSIPFASFCASLAKALSIASDAPLVLSYATAVATLAPSAPLKRKSDDNDKNAPVQAPLEQHHEIRDQRSLDRFLARHIGVSSALRLSASCGPLVQRIRIVHNALLARVDVPMPIRLPVLRHAILSTIPTTTPHATLSLSYSDPSTGHSTALVSPSDLSDWLQSGAPPLTVTHTHPQPHRNGPAFARIPSSFVPVVQ